MGWDEFSHFDVVLEERNGRLRQIIFIEVELLDKCAMVDVFDGPE